MIFSSDDLSAETQGQVMHVKLTVHTWTLWTTECPDAALFIFHAMQRKSTEADKGNHKTHTDKHTHSST